MKGVVYYELLKLNQTITAEQLSIINRFELCFEKLPIIAQKKKKYKVILLHNNAQLHIAKVVKGDSIKYVISTSIGILSHTAYSSDYAPSDYHLFRLMQHGFAN